MRGRGTRCYGALLDLVIVEPKTHHLLGEDDTFQTSILNLPVELDHCSDVYLRRRVLADGLERSQRQVQTGFGNNIEDT